MKYLYNGVCLQNQRQSNMDSVLLKSGIINHKAAFLAVVCDGVGSLSDGAFASCMIVQMLNEWFDNILILDRIGLKMRDAILDINTHVISEAKTKNIKTASTLSALLMLENNYYISHIGDSRIYCYYKDKLSLLTNDDVSDTGNLSACIGCNEDVFLHYSEGVADDKTFLLCSDGLYKRMEMDFMTDKIRSLTKRSLKAAIEALPQYVIKRGEKDNITLALVKIEN